MSLCYWSRRHGPLRHRNPRPQSGRNQQLLLHRLWMMRCWEASAKGWPPLQLKSFCLMGRSCRASDVATHELALTADSVPADYPAMGFNRRKMEDARKTEADKEARARRGRGPQILEDAERLIAACNERRAKRMPMLFAPTIGAAIAARHWWLWVRCPACRTTNAIDLRSLDRHPGAAITSLIPALSCRSRRPHAAFAELLKVSPTSVAGELNASYN